MIKLIIFDFDGVIIEGSNEGYFRCYHNALEDVGVRLDPAEERRRILAKWGKGYKEELEFLLKENKELLPAAIKAYEHYYYDTDLFLRDIQLISGAKETLHKLSAKYKLAIATGMMSKTLKKFLEKFDLNMFNSTLSVDEVEKKENQKPSAFMLNKIMKDLNIEKEEAVCVGDGSNDVLMARNAGVTPIVVLTGHLNRQEAEKLAVKHIVDNVNLIEQEINRIA